METFNASEGETTKFQKICRDIQGLWTSKKSFRSFREVITFQTFLGTCEVLEAAVVFGISRFSKSLSQLKTKSCKIPRLLLSGTYIVMETSKASDDKVPKHHSFGTLQTLVASGGFEGSKTPWGFGRGQIDASNISPTLLKRPEFLRTSTTLSKSSKHQKHLEVLRVPKHLGVSKGPDRVVQNL